MSPRANRIALALALLALAGVFAVWFVDRGHLSTALAVFIAPPLLLAFAVLAGSRLATFASGVLALFWFSHGVMEAWSEPATRGLAWAEIVLALAIIALSSWPGLAARFGRRQKADSTEDRSGCG